jgi:hypothetical protein
MSEELVVEVNHSPMLVKFNPKRHAASADSLEVHDACAGDKEDILT